MAKFTPKNLVMTQMTREFVLFVVEQGELDRLRSGFTSVHLPLCGIAIGVLATTATTMATVTMPDSTYRLFFTALLISIFFTLYCALMAFRDWWMARNVVLNIRSKSNAPLATPTQNAAPSATPTQ